jgi:hypothetical protein
MAVRFEMDARHAGDISRVYDHPGRAALAGLNAFAEGRYGAAFAALSAARPEMPSIGGSHAQRDVFERITIDAGLRAGRYDHTEEILKDRIARRADRADRFARTRLARLQASRRIPAQ